MDKQTLDNILSPLHAPEIIGRADTDTRAAMKEQHDNNDWLSQQTVTTLNWLFAGIGGALAWAASLVSGHLGAVMVGAIALCAYLIAVAAYLVLAGFALRDFPAQHADARGWLYAPESDPEDVRRQVLLGLLERLDKASRHNAGKAAVLNRARWLAVASPLVPLLVGLLARRLGW